jgi:hypothetical protein
MVDAAADARGDVAVDVIVCAVTTSVRTDTESLWRSAASTGTGETASTDLAGAVERIASPPTSTAVVTIPNSTRKVIARIMPANAVPAFASPAIAFARLRLGEPVRR